MEWQTNTLVDPWSVRLYQELATISPPTVSCLAALKASLLREFPRNAYYDGCRAIHHLTKGNASAKTPRRLGGFFRNDADHRDFTAIGTAAGTEWISALSLGDAVQKVNMSISLLSIHDGLVAAYLLPRSSLQLRH